MHDHSFCWLAAGTSIKGRWFSPGPPVSATNKTDSHDITEILLKVALNTIKQTNKGKFSKIQVTENITYNEIRQIDCQLAETGGPGENHRPVASH
jgi:hypothetical protein